MNYTAGCRLFAVSHISATFRLLLLCFPFVKMLVIFSHCYVSPLSLYFFLALAIKLKRFNYLQPPDAKLKQHPIDKANITNCPGLNR